MKKISNQSVTIALLGIIVILLAYFVLSVTSDYRQIRKNTEQTSFNVQKVVDIFDGYEIQDLEFITK